MRKLVAIAIAIISITSIANARVYNAEYVTVGEVKSYLASMSNILKMDMDIMSSKISKNPKAKEIHDKAMAKQGQ